MDDAPARRRRGPYAGTAERRQAILHAAFDVFARSGYRGGSMRDIAQRLGVSHTTLLHHFPTKSDLLSGVLRLRDDIAQATRDTAEEPGPGLLHWLVDIVDQNQRTPGLVSLYCVLSAEATDSAHPAHGYFQDRYAMLVGDLQATFETMAARGQLRDEIDPHAEAQDLIALMDGLQVQWLLKPDGLDMAQRVRDHLAGLIRPGVLLG